MQNYKMYCLWMFIITIFLLFNFTNLAFSLGTGHSTTVISNTECVVLKDRSCPSGYYPFLALSDYINAHAELHTLNKYNYTLCCNASIGGQSLIFDVISSTSGCPTNYNCFLHLSNETNAHAELCSQSNYIYSICVNATSPDPTLRLSDFKFSAISSSQPCPSGTKCVVLLSSNTNAHIFNCSYSVNNGWKICMSITPTNVPPQKPKVFEIRVPPSITTYEGEEMRFLIYIQNKDTRKNILSLKLVSPGKILLGKLYFTSKEYFRNDRAKLDVFLKPGETKYVVVSVIPPFNGTYTIKLYWETQSGLSGEEQTILYVKSLSSAGAPDMPGVEPAHLLFIIIFSTIVLIKSN